MSILDFSLDQADTVKGVNSDCNPKGSNYYSLGKIVAVLKKDDHGALGGVVRPASSAQSRNHINICIQ